MKLNISQLCLLLLSFLLLVCCNKKADDPIVQPKETKLARIQQGVDPATDTVYLISYNKQGKIDMIRDSTHHVSLNASYDARGRLSNISTIFSFNASYTYDANDLLTEINTEVVGQHDQYIFTYNNGVIAEKKWYSEISPGAGLSLWATFKYTVTDGNITNIKEYRSGGFLASDKDLEYDLEPNPFKELSLFNFANVLGADKIFNFETYFNKNILYTYSVNGIGATDGNAENDNLYDNAVDSDHLLSITTFVDWGNAVDYNFYTWLFSYK